MARTRKSKTNETFFRNIPSEDNLKELKKYQIWESKLSQKKAQLKILVKEAGKLNTKYQNYLEDNPHKQPKKEINERVKILRTDLMHLIPDKFNSNSK